MIVLLILIPGIKWHIFNLIIYLSDLTSIAHLYIIVCKTSIDGHFRSKQRQR